MKLKTLTFLGSTLAIVLAMGTTSAQPLTPNEIFSAIDGEYDYGLENDSRTSRVNFSISPEDSMGDDVLSSVLSGVDGEYHQ